jgi:MFS family permease
MNILGRSLAVRGQGRSRPATTPLSPAAVRRGLRLSIGEGMLAQVHISLTIGATMTGLALLLGAGNLTLAILTAMPTLLQPMQLLSAWLMERQGARKPLTVAGSLGRFFWLLLIPLPYLPWGTSERLGVLLVTVGIGHALLTMCANCWTHWMTDLVPPRERGRYFGTRNTALAVVAMAVNFASGTWLDHMRAAGQLADAYAALFAVGGMCGAISTLLLVVQPEPPMQRIARLPLHDILRVPLRNAQFRQFLRAHMGWQIAVGIAAPFFAAQALTVLHLPFQMLATFDVITAATSLLALSAWGGLADRVGHRRVLVIGMVIVIPLPLAWVFATPTTLWPLYLNATIAGLGWSAVNQSLFNRLMEQAPAESRGAYLAVYGTLTGLACFGASVLAGGVANLLAGVTWHLAGWPMNNYQTLFLLACVLRAAVPLFGRKSL